MFKAGQTNPYDDIVVKTTDENLTSENWELILNLCDKVQDEGESGARNVIAAVIKRLAHRNPNVQLYSLSLVEALQKNCGITVHREIASRAFTQALDKLVTDRTTHDKVRRRTLSLIATWTAEFENDATLGIMEDLYNSLNSKNYKFETPQEPPPLDVDDEIRRKEEEELQRALEMSVHDKGGRKEWAEYSAYSSSGAGGSSSAPGYGASSSASAVGPSSVGPGSSSSSTYRRDSYAQPSTPTYVTGYTAVPPRPDPARGGTPAAIASVTAPSSSIGPAPSTSPPAPSSQPIVTRVRALHTFEPSEQGELAFEKGDIIKVVDRGYKDWWRGQLKGRTGIFPVNYVESLPEPTPAELAREAEQEAAVFYQAMNVDRLLTLLRHLDPDKDNLADNEEIQELYRQCMSLRPKIVKLIEKYSQKRADLISMNEGFIKARTIYERMMEESLARHTQVYDSYRPASQYPRPGSAAPGQEYGPQAYGWNPSVYNQPGYNAFPAPATPYTPGQEGYPPQPPPQQTQQQPYGESSPFGAQQPQQQQQRSEMAAYAAQQPNPYQQLYGNVSRGPSYDPQSIEGGPYAGTPAQQPQQQPQQQPAAQPQLAASPAAASPAPHVRQTSQLFTQPQAQPQSEPQRQQSVGPGPQQAAPPFVFDPNTPYADPNVQAWAQYYAQGGKDPTGSVYFISVPGVKEPPPQAAAQDAGHNPYAGQQQDPNGSQTSLGSAQSPYGSATQSATDLNGTVAGTGETQLARHPSVVSTVVPPQSASASNVNPLSTQQENPAAAARSPRAQSFHQAVTTPAGDGSGVSASASYHGSSPPQDQHQGGTGYPSGVDPYGAGYPSVPSVPKSPGAAGIPGDPGWPGYGPGLASQFSAMHIQQGETTPAQ